MRQRDVDEVEGRIAVYRAWRGGTAAAGVAAGALWGLGLIAAASAASAVAAALLLGVVGELKLRGTVRRCVTVSQLAHVGYVARARARMCSASHRHAFARSLRDYATSEGRSRFDVTDHARRAPLVREELVALADELDAAVAVDPVTMLVLDELLHDGLRSPLLNAARPMHELIETLGRLAFRLRSANAERMPPDVGPGPRRPTTVPRARDGSRIA